MKHYDSNETNENQFQTLNDINKSEFTEGVLR
jgi:hypothetical protein